MSFSFSNLFRFVREWLTSMSWTPRRALIVVAFFIVVPLVEGVVWAGLLLDRVFFSRYREQQVTEPLFVIGNFRSGTTFLHRLLAGDRRRFTTMQMWEVLFAPSVTLRRVYSGLAAVDGWLGRPVARFLAWVESRWHDENVMHEVSMTQPEEDEYLCLHIWSALTIGLSSGLLDEARPYAWFDSDLPGTDKRRVMAFYFSCVQRHLVAHGAGQYLAKNPAATPKLDSLLDRFPDARVVCLVRNPLEAVPSFVNMMKFSWEVVGAPADAEALRDFVIEMAGHWYRYPLERLARAPEDSYRIVVYDELVRDPAGVVNDIYAHFGYEIDADFERLLAAATAEAGRYRTRHEYDLDDLGIDREAIVADFADIFERFGFRH